jgi:hypothetical protein
MRKESTYYHYLPFFILYFFFNNFLLREGLLYTTLLTPVFLYWLYKRGKIKALAKWSVLLLIPVPFHLVSGVDTSSYIVSTLMVVTALVFLFTAGEAVRLNKDNLDDFFRKAMIVNSALFVIAILVFPFPPVRDFMWNSEPMSSNLSAIPRLQMLAYEPSHYGLLLAPVFLFFFLRILTGKSGHPLLLAFGIGLPLILSFSFGILGILFIAVLIGSIAYFHKYSGFSRRMVIYGMISILLMACGLWLLWPGNPVYIRIENILTGADSSSKGRLVYSFMFAKDLVMQHNAWFGVGPGQVKILAHDLIVNFYQYTGEYAETVRIPNSMGEMLATYGIIGFTVKILVEIILFIRLKIYRNLYALMLFMFIFIYQFTGSFLVNAAELGIWAIVFQGRFPDFEIGNINPDHV